MLIMVGQNRAWVIPVKGLDGRQRFGAVVEAILFPGRAAKVYASWASMAGVRAWAKREGRNLQKGECPLPRISEADRQAYHRRVEMRQDAFAVWPPQPAAA